ncbi:kinase [Cobetia amphilecti]|uniref:4-(cytidine 5'-diphospho)-2-C-methyl-D-erythritol kinase n=1 Tax=Cobetia amphilecti TaxID=1055104 RepID=UPI0005013C29|nr:4-(cytidine 5'-diphospho)-2-C-methyl-D-erythritol kinase [Cobetia amphilecti]KGA01231.1 kinase [Cobetia amphilecti]
MTLTLPAPAKLNRMLHITGQRADGYHELQTLFQFLEHGDSLSFTLRDDEAIHLSPPIEGVPEEANLIVRAARLLREAAHAQGKVASPTALPGVDITLEKVLPMGGGLGGGSSDAATTLLALDRLWGLELGEDALAELGLSLGADVPVFVRGFAAWAEGIGERLVPAPLDTPWFVVIHPGVEVATPAVFGHPQLTRSSLAISMARALQGGRNDCEVVVRTLYPAVADALDWLDQFGTARLTGTGACVFCAFDDARQASEVLGRLELERPMWHAFSARGCNISPLHAALASA